jgi:hypothetical protein
MQAAYKTAGIINRVVAEIIKILKEHDPWLEYVLAKTLYQLWLAKLNDRDMKSNTEFWVDSKEMVAFMVQPRWHQFGFPDLAGLKNVRAPAKKKKGPSKKKAPPKKPPTQQILAMCAKVKARVERNRNAMGGHISEEELGPDDEPNLPDDFYDDSDLDDIPNIDDDDFDDDEFDYEKFGDGYFSDEDFLYDLDDEYINPLKW